MSNSICFLLCAIFLVAHAKPSEPLPNDEAQITVVDLPGPVLVPDSTTDNEDLPEQEPTAVNDLAVSQNLSEKEKIVLDNAQSDASINGIAEALTSSSSAAPFESSATISQDVRDGTTCPKFFDAIGPCIKGLCPIGTFCLLSSDACCRRSGFD